jgi:hypothetical protein
MRDLTPAQRHRVQWAAEHVAQAKRSGDPDRMLRTLWGRDAAAMHWYMLAHDSQYADDYRQLYDETDE